MNVERLRKIKDHILEEPLRVNMGPLICSRGNRKLLDANWCIDITLPLSHRRRWPDCGTVGCIAGWEIILYGHPETEGANDAERRLELPNDDLFYVYRWPGGLRDKISGLRGGTPAYAAVVAEAIESYISSNGWEGEEA